MSSRRKAIQGIAAGSLLASATMFPLPALAHGPAFERVEQKPDGITMYYLNCHQAEHFEQVAGSTDAALRVLGQSGSKASYVSKGFSILRALGFTNLSADTVRRMNYDNPSNRTGCHGIRIGQAKWGPFTVGLLVSRR